MDWVWEKKGWKKKVEQSESRLESIEAILNLAHFSHVNLQIPIVYVLIICLNLVVNASGS